jgi:hypothetical protein
MATLITYPPPDYDTLAEVLWAHKVEENELGQPIKVRAVRSRPLYRVEMGWSEREYATLAAFIDALHGLRDGYTECCIWTPGLWDRWTLCPVGTGNNSDTEFVFGAASVQATTLAVTVAGAAETHVTAAAKAGDSDGRWALTFAGGYEPNGAILCSFNGSRLLLGRFGISRVVKTADYATVSLAVSFLGREVEATA